MNRDNDRPDHRTVARASARWLLDSRRSMVAAHEVQLGFVDTGETRLRHRGYTTDPEPVPILRAAQIDALGASRLDRDLGSRLRIDLIEVKVQTQDLRQDLRAGKSARYAQFVESRGVSHLWLVLAGEAAQGLDDPRPDGSTLRGTIGRALPGWGLVTSSGKLTRTTATVEVQPVRQCVPTREQIQDVHGLIATRWSWAVLHRRLLDEEDPDGAGRPAPAPDPDESCDWFPNEEEG